MSVNKDYSDSWVRISHGLNTIGHNLNNKDQDDNEHETSEMQFEDYAVKSSVRASLRADPRPRQNHQDVLLLAHPQDLYLSVKELGKTWTDVEPQDYSLTDFSVSKQLINLFRHGSLFGEDGVFEFWRFEVFFVNHVCDEMWKSILRGGGEATRIFPYCTDSTGQENLYLQALQGHSGRNPIDPSLQDNVLIPNDFFEYICHVGCAVSSHSITNSGLIPGGQNLRERQSVFFTSVDPMNKEHVKSIPPIQENSM